MNWNVTYSPASQRQLRKLDPQIKARIVRYMRERVLEAYSPYSEGKQLAGDWTGHWRYRVGDYRVVCILRDRDLLVSVVRVGHRSSVYLNPPH